MATYKGKEIIDKLGAFISVEMADLEGEKRVCVNIPANDHSFFQQTLEITKLLKYDIPKMTAEQIEVAQFGVLCRELRKGGVCKIEIDEKSEITIDRHENNFNILIFIRNVRVVKYEQTHRE